MHYTITCGLYMQFWGLSFNDTIHSLPCEIQ